MPIKPIHRLRGRQQNALYEDGGRGKGESVVSAVGWSASCAALPVDEQVQVERPQPRSGEDVDLDARGTGGTMGTPLNQKGLAWRFGGGRAGCEGAALISLSPPRRRTRWDGRGFAPVAHLS